MTLPQEQVSGPAKRSLAEEFELLLKNSGGKGVSLGDAMHALRERGMAVVMLIVAIPFLIPVPTTFGLSTPAGLGVMLLGLYVMMGREAKLPQWMGKRRLTHGTLERVVWFSRKYERLVRPRLKFMTWPGIDRFLGLSIIFAGKLPQRPQYDRLHLLAKHRQIPGRRRQNRLTVEHRDRLQPGVAW